jgi:uncharacterized protein YgiM (DUF1202 family)
MEHNQILLYTKSGKRVSIIQSNEDTFLCKGTYGKTVEVMINEDEPHCHLNFERLVKLLQDL